MISASQEAVHTRARTWVEALGQGEVVQGESTIGGGSLPGETLPTSLLALTVRSPNRVAKQLRLAQPPIIARLENDRVMLDPRTVLPEQDTILLEAINQIL
jgi:L-seryl-tRNA(Ser) seleniumtransferase